MCSTVCVIHKNSLLLNQHNGDDAPQDCYMPVAPKVMKEKSTHPYRNSNPEFSLVDIYINMGL